MTAINDAVARDFYQLKIYTLETGRQERRLDAFLEDAWLPALHRAGIEHVGVFKPLEDGELSGGRIFVLVPFDSLDRFAGLDEVLAADAAYREAGADYIDAAHDDPPYQRIESILLRAFASMPEYGVPDHPTPASERVYELRSYQAATEKLYRKKVAMFDTGGETEIFLDLGFQPVFFGETLSGATMPNLMYLTTFATAESQEQHWQAFREDSRWEELRDKQEYENTVSKNVKTFLRPTEYSDL